MIKSELMLLNGYVTSQEDNELKYRSLQKQPFPWLLPYIVKRKYLLET